MARNRYQHHGYNFRPNVGYAPYNPYYAPYGPYYGGIYSPYPMRDPLYTYYDAMYYNAPRPSVVATTTAVAPAAAATPPAVPSKNMPLWMLGGVAIVALAAVSVIIRRS